MKERRTVKMPLKRTPPRPRPAAPKLRARTAVEESEIEDYEGEAEPNMRFSHALFVVLILHVIAVAGVFAFNSIKAREAEKSRSAQSQQEVRGPVVPDTTAAGETSPAKTSITEPAPATAKVQEPPATTATGVKTHTVVAGDTLGKIAKQYKTSVEALEKANGITSVSMIRVGQILEIPEPGAMPKTSAPAQAAPAKAPSKGIITSVVKTTGSAPAGTSNPAPAAEAAPKPELPADGTYTVVKGDNPYSIARKFHVSYQALLEANNIEDPTKIQIGQKLKIPGQ